MHSETVGGSSVSGNRKVRTGIHLDVGHASIGWAVTTQLGGDPSTMRVEGAGSVIFPPDKCLASVRRGFRRQRRRIRSTRQRIARLATVLQERGILTRGQAGSNACACPWLLAAGVLGGVRRLSWLELWYVLRWYAHNRGYDGNRLCLRHGGEEDGEDKKMNEAARARMAELGTRSMAETFCRMLELEPDGRGKRSSREAFKNTGLSFDRAVVAEEVRRIVESHKGILPGLDDELVRIILADPVEDADALREVEGLPIHVPKRYVGGILFGQLAPRFDNRIIGICPKTGEKLPLKSAPEFLDFRFASMLANIRLSAAGGQRALTASERRTLMEAAREQGGFTKTEFKKVVRETTGVAVEETNLEALLLPPDADESLVLYPGLYELRRKKVLPLLKDRLAAKHLAHTLLRGKKLSTDEIAPYLRPDQMGAFQKVTQNKRGKTFSIEAKVPSGRAPYARSILKQATQAILDGTDPKTTGGVLYRDATVADRVKEKDLGDKTNNHLVRHRIAILQRVIKDIIHDYAENNPARIHTVTIEVAREVKEFSGMTNKDIAAEMTQLTAAHRDAAKKLAQALGIDNIRTISAGLIRKARLALELGCRCPYTGKPYDLRSVANKSLMDKDHILPHSQ
ncbi:MAG: type II CRISPR RNA-guided endonuclease Cas9, partial [Kiritimatiellia bacterium]